jgi:hypothetical protein
MRIRRHILIGLAAGALGMVSGAERVEASTSQYGGASRHRVSRHYRSYGYRGHSYRPYSSHRSHYYRSYYYSPYYYGYGYWPSYYYSYRPPLYGYNYGYGPDYSYWSGALRLQVKPVETEVYVDGYYAGIVDDFDGVFQRLYLRPGEHDIVLRLDGYRNREERVLVRSGHTQKVHFEMRPLPAGAEQEPRPEPNASRRYRVREVPDREEVEAPREAERPRARPSEVDPAETSGRSSSTTVAAARFGRLALRIAPPGAEVFIDGERWGSLEEAEGMVIHLPAGRHRIEIRLEGYQPFAGDVDVAVGEEATLNVQLTR